MTNKLVKSNETKREYILQTPERPNLNDLQVTEELTDNTTNYNGKHGCDAQMSSASNTVNPSSDTVKQSQTYVSSRQNSLQGLSGAYSTLSLRNVRVTNYPE